LEQRKSLSSYKLVSSNSLGATVDGQPCKAVIAKITSGEIKVE